jgi:hypothetical protein
MATMYRELDKALAEDREYDRRADIVTLGLIAW